MQEAAGREALLQSPDEIVSALTFVGPTASVFHSADWKSSIEMKVGSPADRKPHVLLFKIAVDRLTQPIKRRPGLVRKGIRHARRLMDARHIHRKGESDFGGIDRTRDRRRGAIMRRRAEWQMAFAAEEPRGRIEPDPAGARNIDFGPGVQIGKIMLSAGGPSSASTSGFN